MLSETINFEKNKMPDLKKFGAKDAVYIAEKNGLKVSLKGRGKVVYQSVKAGTDITKGMTVNLVLKLNDKKIKRHINKN